MSSSMNQPENPRKDSHASPYVPLPASIERVTRLTERERLYKVRPVGKNFVFDPGQFFMAGLPGYGEAPFSTASPAGAPGDPSFELCIRAVGNLTRAIHRLKKGEVLWIRGPFGRGFKVSSMKGKDIVFIAGGIGMVPMRGLIKTILAERPSFGRLMLVYGSKSPDEVLFKDEILEWKTHGLEAELTIDAPSPGWQGNVGVVTRIIPGLELDPSRTSAVVIGPPVMYRFVVKSLWDKKIPRDEIILSLERKMKCGVGKCGHCQINNVYTCQEGPVFRLSEIKNLYEALYSFYY